MSNKAKNRKTCWKVYVRNKQCIMMSNKAKNIKTCWKVYVRNKQ